MNRLRWKNLLLVTVCGSAFCCSELVAPLSFAGGMGGRRAGGASLGGGGFNRGNFGGGGMPNVSRHNMGGMQNVSRLMWEPCPIGHPLLRCRSRVLKRAFRISEATRFPAAICRSLMSVVLLHFHRTSLEVSLLANRLPGNAVTRPAFTEGNSRLPGGQLNPEGMPNFSKLPAGRPSASDLGNYLGLDRPVRPETKPAMPERPNIERPNVTNPNVTRPNLNRPNNERPPVNIARSIWGTIQTSVHAQLG